MRGYGKTKAVKDGGRSINEVTALNITGFDLVMEPSDPFARIVESRDQEDQDVSEEMQDVQERAKAQAEKELATKQQLEEAKRKAAELEAKLAEAEKAQAELEERKRKDAIEAAIAEATKGLPYGEKLNGQFVEAVRKAGPADAEAVASVLRALHSLTEAVEGGGALAAALALRERQLTLEAQLAAQGVERRSLRAEVHFAAGVLAWRLSRRAEAIPHYAQHNALLRALLAEAPQDQNLRVRLGHGLLNLGELRVLTGDAAGARAAFDDCLQVRQALVDAGADAPARLTELAWAQARLAQFGDDPAARWAVVESLLVRADAAQPLGDLEEELLTVARIVVASRVPR